MDGIEEVIRMSKINEGAESLEMYMEIESVDQKIVSARILKYFSDIFETKQLYG